jgi:sec-independent protein translocase protein TatA
MFGINHTELIILGIIALLLFGKRLPEVARSLGKGLTEFKRGMRGIEDEMHGAFREPTRETPQRRPEPARDDERELRAPKFEPPTSEPVAASSSGEESA